MDGEEFRDLQTTGRVAEPLPADATPLDFLSAVYRDPEQPMGRRLTAAIAAAPFCHVKLSATANVDKESFARMMEEIGRASGKSNVIDAKANRPRLPATPIETDPAEGR